MAPLDLWTKDRTQFEGKSVEGAARGGCVMQISPAATHVSDSLTASVSKLRSPRRAGLFRHLEWH